MITIRPMHPDDRPALVKMLVDFQDYERALHENRRPGAAVAKDYCTEMETAAAANRGMIFVACLDGAPVGFIACRADHDDDQTILETARPHGYISDVFVVAGQRGRGCGAKLLRAAEDHLAGLGLATVRLWVLAANRNARMAYEKAGYGEYEVIYEKTLGGP